MNGTGGIGTARNFYRTCSYASRQHHRLQILAAALFSTPAMLQHGAQWGDMVTMACARPDRDPEMLALDHIPPLGPARGASQRFRGDSGVTGGRHQVAGSRSELPGAHDGSGGVVRGKGQKAVAPQQREVGDSGRPDSGGRRSAGQAAEVGGEGRGESHVVH